MYPLIHAKFIHYNKTLLGEVWLIHNPGQILEIIRIPIYVKTNIRKIQF